MTKNLRIYLSFDLEHDRDLHDRLLEQSRRHPAFAIANHSQAGEMTAAWTERVRDRISESDEVIVICGEHTDESPRMSAELGIAQEQRKPYVLLWGRRDRMCKKPKGARADDGMYRWTPDILRDQIAFTLRRSRQPEVTESMKRQVPAPRI